MEGIKHWDVEIDGSTRYWVEWKNRPPVIYIDRDLVLSGELQMRRGYFSVYRPEERFDWVYADWWIWPWMKAQRLAYTGFWKTLKWLYRHGLIHPTNHPSERIRLRGLRLGRGER